MLEKIKVENRGNLDSFLLMDGDKEKIRQRRIIYYGFLADIFNTYTKSYWDFLSQEHFWSKERENARTARS